MRAQGWRASSLRRRSVLWFALAPLGFVAYGLFLRAVRGDFLAMFHSYDLTADWAYHVFNPNIFYTILKEVYALVLSLFGDRPFTVDTLVQSVLPLAALSLLLAASVYVLIKVRGRATALGIFGLVCIVFFTLNNNLVSVHRYVLPCIVIYIAAAIVLQRYRKLNSVFYSVVYGSILLQALLVALLARGWFVG